MTFYPKDVTGLKSAIAGANDGDTISLQAGFTYLLNNSNYANDTTDGVNGLPNVTKNITIIGNGATIARDPSSSAFRILHVAAGKTVKLQGLTIKGGKAQGTNNDGGGIYNLGNLTLDSCVIIGNDASFVAPAGMGGGVSNRSGGQLTITNTLFAQNTAFRGGAIGNTGSDPLVSTVSITNSIITKNSVTGSGGGIFNGIITSYADIQNLTVAESTIFDNSAVDGGGVYVFGGTVNFQRTDLYRNAAGRGGGLFVRYDPLPLLGPTSTITMNYNRIFENSSLVDVANATDNAAIDATNNWWGANNGPSLGGSGDGDSISGSSLVNYLPILSKETADHLGIGFCGICFGNADAVNSTNPISLRLGEKRLDVTDLSLNSPAGAFEFIRSYRQDQQSKYQFMGLGWLHNHIYGLSFTGTSPTRTATIDLPTGGTAVLKEIVAGHFEASAGSTAVMDYKSATSEYILVAQDRSQYVFDATALQLKSRSWPNNESWAYSYYQPVDGVDLDGKLKQVSDGNGRTLQFAYYRDTEPIVVQRRQLRRVGDQTAAGLDTTGPTGRYVEFVYTTTKSNGVDVGTPPKALLLSAKDVRGNTWTYDYYGQHSGVGETDPNQLNWMTKRLSPSVDTTGDGNPDGALTLEKLTYLFNYPLELAVNGNMEADNTWVGIPGATPTTNQQSSTQVFSGSYSRFVSANAVDKGIEGTLWNVLLGRSYVITAHVYPVSGVVTMRVSGITALDQTTSGTGAWKTLTINHTPVADRFNQTLQFIAAGGAADFYVDSVSIQETNAGFAGTTQERGIQGANPALLTTDFIIRPNGQELTTETITAFGKPTTHRFDRGLYAGAQDPAGNYAPQTPNDQFRPAFQSDAKGNRTWLNWSADGKRLNQVTDALGNASQFGYKTDEALNHSVDAEGRKTIYAYENATVPRQPTLVLVTNGGDLAVNGGMENNSNWANVGSPTTAQSTTQVDTGSYAWHITATAAGQGIQGDPWGLVAGRAYVILARVYPVSGVVRMKVNGAPAGAFDKTTSGTGSWQTLRAVYKATANANPVQLQFLADGAAADFYVDTVSIQDSIMLLRWQDFTYDPKGRSLTEKTFDPVNPPPSGTPTQSVVREYYTSGDGNGLLKKVTQTFIGGGNDTTTEYTYDTAGRVIQIKQGSLAGDCCGSQTTYDAAGNVLTTKTIRDWAAQSDPIASPVAQYTYDEAGRRVKTITNVGTTFAQTSLTVYDALNRVIRTISNYVIDAGVPNPYTALRSAFNHGTDNNQNLVTDTAYNARGTVKSQTDVLGNVILFGYDDAGRLVKTVQSASQPSYNNDYNGGSPDPTLNSYVANGVVDQDIVTTQVYDAVGNLVKTGDTLSSVAYTVYDTLNRPVKTVRAAKDTARIDLNPGDAGYDATLDPRSDSYVISTSPDRDLIETTEYDTMRRVFRTKRLLDNRPSAQWDTTLFGYDTLGRQVLVIRNASQPDYSVTGDPSLASYFISPNADQDIITRTAYDAQQRVMYTEDALGSRTWIAYDGLGRQVKTIANAVGTATDGGVNDPRSGSYVPSSAADKDLITTTTYDSNGRVQSTQDALNRVALNVFDSLGRVSRTITNYVAQGATDPKDWVWSSTNNRWEYGAANTTPISHGTDNDQNIIAETVYDSQSRVSQTIDNRHNITQFVYDVLGRRVKTIVNYVVQGASNPANWVWDAVDNRWEDGAGTAISFGIDKDQNRITSATYDLAGRVTNTRDGAGIETRFQYDLLGRRTQTIANYVNGVFSSAAPDEDLISTTTYNKGGQVVTTTDARSTQTAFVYDKVGRRLNVTQAASNPLSSIAYTSFDKAGRALRSIQNWIDNGTSPDSKDGSGNWLFVPPHNGAYEDRNLITLFEYDLASRRTKVTDPLGNFSQTTYFKDGQVQSMTDPENAVTQYRYDGLRRRFRVVQGYVVQGASDPKDWIWDATDVRWEYPSNNPVVHGTNNDQNIIVDVTYDKGGRTLTQRDPRGNVTSYAYDQLDRRKSLTSPLSKVWSTAYSDLTGGGSRTTVTYPGITGAANYPMQRDFDRLGRPLSVAYGAPSVTADVKFTYDDAGNQAKMSEYSGAGFTSRIRETTFSYDDVRRLTSAGFDNDGSGSVDETVAYEYDAGGLRTKLTMPGSLNVVYTYDAKGQLVSLTDWDSQQTQFAYDQAGRHIATERANGLRSRYEIDAVGRLKRLRHTKDFRTLAHFEYEVDKRGNRVQALEALANPTTTTDTVITSTDKGLALSGTWSDVGGFKESSQFNASLKLLFLGDEATLTMGQGPDHSIYDVYVGGSLWQSFDGYAASAGQRDIVITIGVDSRKLQGEGLHLIEIRNRAEKNKTSTGYKLRFKQLLVVDRTWTQQTVKYNYDKLSRLLEARYAPGVNGTAVDADLLRRYLYTYDRSGNRLSQSIAINGGAPTVTNYSYNVANQLSSGGATYDNNGNLTSDGTNSYTWDRANRLLSWLNVNGADQIQDTYKYDGLGNRYVQNNYQLIGGIEGLGTQKYLLDLQPGLATVLRRTQGASSHTYYVHGLRGIHAHKDAVGAWEWMVQDGLGSVRGVVDNSVGVLESRNYDPYGTGFGATGSSETAYGFTGEPTDDNGLLYLRARYYRPAAGVFTALDPFEGVQDRAMSLNGYLYVEGNVPNTIDPSGKYWFLDTSSDLTKKMPLPDLSDVRVEYYLSKLIQTEALGNPFIHAEYPVLNDNFIDLLGVNDAERKIRYWEIKANNPNGISTGKASILDTSLALPIAAGKGELSSTHTTSVENPGYTYDWNSYTWSPGFNYPLRVLGQSTDGKRYWFARQGTEPATGSQIPGLITYWYEEREDDPKDIPWFLGIARRNIPDDIPQRPRVPNNIIPLFPTEEEESGEPAAAACGLVPSPGGFSFYNIPRLCIPNTNICLDFLFLL